MEERGIETDGNESPGIGDASADDRPADHPAVAAAKPERLWEVPIWLDRLTGWAWRLAVVALAALVMLRIFWILRLVTVPVLFALILTALLWPARRFLADRGLPAAISTAAVMVIAAVTIGSAVWLTSVGVGRELADDEVWNQTRDEVETWLMDGPLDLSRSEIDDYEDRVTTTITSGAVSVGMNRARLIVELVGASILSAILLFFFLKDGPQMWTGMSRRLQEQRRDVVNRSGMAAFTALSGYARGVAITGVIDGIAVGLVMVVLGVPLALPLALLTAFAAFIPIVGATAIGALSTVVALVTVGPQAAVILAVATLVIQQVEGDLVLPLAMGTQVQLHPAVVLIVLAIGGAAAGLVGAFVAVPIAAMVAAAIREFRLASKHQVLASDEGTTALVVPERRLPSSS